MDERLWYTPTHAAEMLDLKPSKLYELMATGDITYVKIAGVRGRRIRHETLVAFIEAIEAAETVARAGRPPVSTARAASAVR